MSDSKPKVKLIGQDGNIFNLMSIAGKALSKEKEKEMCDRIYDEAENYGQALTIIQDYVEII